MVVSANYSNAFGCMSRPYSILKWCLHQYILSVVFVCENSVHHISSKATES